MSLKALEKKLNYRFNDIGLLRQALTHRSAKKKNNERLEFLGDSIVGFCIAYGLFKRYPNLSEGDLTRMRARLVSGKFLAQQSRNLGLSDYLVLGPGELKSGGFKRDTILADAFEAIIAAIYLDSDIGQTFVVIETLFADALQSVAQEDLKDPKTRLQEWLQSQQLALPIYELTDTSGPDHKLVFTVACRLYNETVLSASASSRRKAEQQVAQQALDILLP